MAAALTQLRTGVRDSIDEFLRLFSSIYFAVSLFAVWGLLTLIGVIVEQGKDPQVYWNNYAPPFARLILRLHFDNIYHSTPYVGIIGLILLSLAVCTFKRVIPARLPPLRTVKIERIPLNATISVQGEERDVRERIERFFRQRGWSVRKREFNGEEWTFADKHNWARRGVLVAHIGFVIITAGTTWYWAQGFSGQTAILSGGTETISETGAKITLDNFAYKIEPIRTKSGLVYQPIDYVSRVHYVGKDGIRRAATIRVNEPLDIDGTLYYQATYGFAVDLHLTKDGRPVPGSPRVPLMEGAGFQIPGTDRSIEYAQFVGTLDRRTGRPGPDPRPNDPAVGLRVFAGDTPVGAALLPLGKAVDLGAGYRLAARRYTLYSGLQYRFDPGIPLVGLGAFVLLAGLCISFYFLPARMFVQLNGAGREWDVGVAATTVKGYDVFEEQFRDLIEALRHATASPAPAPTGPRTAPATA